MLISELERRSGDLVHQGLDVEGLCLEFDRLLRDEVPYAAAAWSTLDPATGLSTSCTMTGIPKDVSREADLFQHEFTDGEPATYLALIERGDTAVILSQVTNGDLERAARYRHLLKGLGVTDEMRVMLRAGGRVWGSATLYRVDGRFVSADAKIASTVAPFVARGIHLALLRTLASHPGRIDDAPGILRASADGTLTPLTEPARRWLTLGGPALTTAANAVAAAVRERRDPSGASVRLPLPSGRVLALHASSMTTEDNAVAVIVDAARPVEVAAILVDAYGLTKRERDVAGLLLLGRSLAEIARELDISEHTVNDHRKAIYRRTGVSSRAELAARLQFEQYSPRSRDRVPPSPYGGFLTA